MSLDIVSSIIRTKKKEIRIFELWISLFGHPNNKILVDNGRISR